MKRYHWTTVHLLVLAAMLLSLVAPSPAAAAPSQAGQVPQVILAIFTVTNTNDSGPGSLRQAILDANASAGADTITFAIGASRQPADHSADQRTAGDQRPGDD